MEIYNYTLYDNFISEQRKVWLNNLCLDIVPEFDDVQISLEKKDMLSYRLFIDCESIGRLLFPWMGGWKYEGEYFDKKAIRDMGRHVYYWIGLWE